jgi:hypothetical protein
MAQLELSNVINISVSEAPQGLGEYNTSNIAIFSDEAYADSFGTDGYKIYLEPSEVATDFGTESRTYKMAVAIFSQQPNILAGGGYLAVIPLVIEKQLVDFDANPVAGAFVLNYGASPSASIAFDDTAAEVQEKLRAVAGLEDVVVTGSITTTGLTVTFNGVVGDVAAMTVTNNTLATGGSAPVAATVSQTLAGETVAAAISRTKDLVQYFGILLSNILAESPMLAAAAVVETLNKMALWGSYDSADVEPAGRLDKLRTGSLRKNRGLYYGGSESGLTSAEKLVELVIENASYAGRGFSTDFNGSNTTQTMHLKDLIGVQPDFTMTQTLLNKCVAAGVDTYVSLQGVPKVFTSGENMFFDQIYNRCWFVGALQVAGFNFLAQSSTKIPQTENGMDGLKGAYRNVAEQARTNLYCAAGVWNSPTQFGNQSDFNENIQQRGYYIYSGPIAQQSQANREARVAPLVQIALKEAGAIQKSNVIIYVNP